MHGQPLVYLDTAATAQKPQCVIDALTSFYRDHYATVHRAIYEISTHATEAYEGVRRKVKDLLNAAKVEEIIFTRGTTDSINIVADSFGKAFVKPGDEIVITEMEHHSNLVPWQLMCEARGAVLKVVPINDRGELKMDEFAKILSSKTKIVAVGHMSNATGTINPVKKIIDMAHGVGAKVLIDGAQSVPHMPVDVQALDADFYVFSGHKLYGPTGIGVLYGKEQLLNEMPPHHGGGDMVDIVTFPKTTYNVLPLKFEPGTPIIAEVIGLGAAIDYIQEIGLDNIQKWETQLLKRALELLGKIQGIRLIGTAPEKGAIISFVVEGTHPLDIGTMLDLRGIAIRTGNLCTQPTMRHFGLSGTCRASFAFYNTLQEVEFFAESLKQVITSMKSN